MHRPLAAAEFLLHGAVKKIPTSIPVKNGSQAANQRFFAFPEIRLIL
jgi:hypothetical protein